MSRYKKLTILHSNDMHGDFHAKHVDEKLMGGVSMLSGYINKVRHEEENVIYAIAGDMFTGSLIDSEYKGISTIEIMNMLTPDIVTLGNHELDYGLGHLLFLEKCARFPIINANMYIVKNNVRLFRSHKILRVDGMSILFIGVLTEEVLSQTKTDKMIGSLVDIWEAAAEVGKICNSYKSVDIDFTVLLTHIGFEEDKKLAAILDPRWGVDIIIGGHTHTLLDQPAMVNGIPVVQAAEGTSQIGRFDIMVDTDKNCIKDFTWELIPIDAAHCPRDIDLENIIASYKDETESKYNRYVTRFLDRYTHPRRDRETDLGKILTDLYKDNTQVDIMLIGSGSIRKDLGPIVRLKDLIEAMPYDEEIHCVTLTGAQLIRALNHIHRPEAYSGAHTEFYQYSKDFKIVYDLKANEIVELTFEGQPIDPDREYKIGLYEFHYQNMPDFMQIAHDELPRRTRLLSAGCHDFMDECLSHREYIKVPEDQRWIVLE